MVLANLVFQWIVHQSDAGLFDFPIPLHSIKPKRDIILMIDGYPNIVCNCRPILRYSLIERMSSGRANITQQLLNTDVGIGPIILEVGELILE